MGAEGLAGRRHRLGVRALPVGGLSVASARAQQKDHLCGPFWAARILRDAGVTDADEDMVAVRAGTVLPEPDGGSVPPGVKSRTNYRFDLPRGAPAESGTSADGLAAALEGLSNGRLRCLPLSGDWTDECLRELIDRKQDARLLANVRTGAF